MFSIKSKTISFNGIDITLESGKIARQADAAVTISSGKSVVLCCVSMSKSVKEDMNFLPLTVSYLEKYYASGKYPGGFFKREAKPSEREVLISRLIDRSIRPLFPSDFFQEVNIHCTVLSYDKNVDTDILAIIGTVAALNISPVPFRHKIAATRIVKPCKTEEANDINLMVSGTNDNILVIELSSPEITKDIFLQEIQVAQQQIKILSSFVESFVSLFDEIEFSYNKIESLEIEKQIIAEERSEIAKTYFVTTEEKKNIISAICDKYITCHKYDENIVNYTIKKIRRSIFREMIQQGKRMDGRTLSDVRPIDCTIDLLPSAHGSALFTRGKTQSLAVLTLGSTQDCQIEDNITGMTSEKFLLHYNFPSYAVGECGPAKPPTRREIGHAKLAKKAVLAVFPKNFPYTVRVVSEITESNGSSSMATVCATTLALMSGGVPVKKHVAGVAMGLVASDDNAVVITDITGEEDALGDMDLKITMTEAGITALQLDIKTLGISVTNIEKTITDSQNACHKILQQMSNVIDKPRTSMHTCAPIIYETKIAKNKIKDVIGTGGKIIKHLSEKSHSKIDIEEDGVVKIFSPNEAKLKIAKTMLDEIVSEPVIGQVYEGKIMKILDFGMFVRFFKQKEGLVHKSEISSEKNGRNIEHTVNDIVKVKFLSYDKKGKIKLSMQNTE